MLCHVVACGVPRTIAGPSARAGAIRCWRLDFDPVNQKPRREEWLKIAKAHKRPHGWDAK